MTFTNLLLIGFGEADFTPGQRKELKDLADDLRFVPKDSPDLRVAMQTADAIGIRLGASFDAKDMDQAPKLRYLGMFGTGYGRIDTRAASARNIVVCNVADYATDAVAEFAFAVLLGRLRETERGLVQARSGDYSEASFAGYELRGKTLGIVGLGNIGRRIAEIGHGFKAKVCYWSRSSRSQLFEFRELDEIMKTCDFVSLNVALTPETTAILDSRRISLLRPKTVLINLAPMELVDLPALEARLTRGEIAFILDHSDEMADEDVRRLQQYQQCHIYPPIAYTTTEAALRKQQIFINNLRQALANSPINKVN